MQPARVTVIPLDGAPIKTMQRPDELPTRLVKDAVLEAICELRFAPVSDSASDILPGLLFAKLSGDYSKIEQLPSAQLPAAMLNADPNLRYAARSRFSSDAGSSVIQVGHSVVGLAFRKPYPGWPAFRAEILRVFEIVEATKSVAEVERFSLRFMNMLSDESSKSDLSALKVNLNFAGESMSDGQVVVRWQRMRAGFAEIIHVITHSQAETDGLPREAGVLLDVDVISNRALPNFWRSMSAELDAAHHECKRVFFSLLTDETLAKLGPRYD